MPVTVETSEGLVVVAADGASGESAAVELRDALLGVVGNAGALVLDFGEVDRIDSAHLAILLALSRELGGSQRLALALSGIASDRLQDWRIDDCVGIYPDRAAAVAAAMKAV